MKLRLAQALVGSDQVPELLWKLAEALNSLRNELSHQLDSPKVEKKFDEVIKLYEEVQKLDPEMSRLAKLRVAIGFMLGALCYVEGKLKTGEFQPLADCRNV